MSEFEKYLCPQCGTMQESLKAELARLQTERGELIEDICNYQSELSRLTAELAELREKTRWIPVSENEILQSNVTRLVYTSDKKMHLAFICEWGWIDDTNTIDYRNVTHWMPLPEPPEAD